MSKAVYREGDALYERRGAGTTRAQPLEEWDAVEAHSWWCGSITFPLGPPKVYSDSERGEFVVRFLEAPRSPGGFLALAQQVVGVIDSWDASGFRHRSVVQGKLPNVARRMARLGSEEGPMRTRYQAVLGTLKDSEPIYPLFAQFMHTALKNPSTAPDPVQLKEQLERMVRELELSMQRAP